jgi:hypothetical protein
MNNDSRRRWSSVAARTVGSPRGGAVVAGSWEVISKPSAAANRRPGASFVLRKLGAR